MIWSELPDYLPAKLGHMDAMRWYTCIQTNKNRDGYGGALPMPRFVFGPGADPAPLPPCSLSSKRSTHSMRTVFN